MWVKIKSLNKKYEITKKGILRNVKTKRIIKWQKSVSGYAVATVRPKENEQKNISIHSLVAEVYLGERPKGYVINHKDGNKLNNDYKNLEYVTYSQNNKHALDKGLRKPSKNEWRYGNNAPRHNISEEQAYEILYNHYKFGYGERKLAKLLNLPRGAVSGVISKSRPRWNHINREEIKRKVEKEKKDA